MRPMRVDIITLRFRRLDERDGVERRGRGNKIRSSRLVQREERFWKVIENKVNRMERKYRIRR